MIGASAYRDEEVDDALESDEGGGVRCPPTRPDGMTGEIVEVGNVFGLRDPIQRGADQLQVVSARK